MKSCRHPEAPICQTCEVCGLYAAPSLEPVEACVKFGDTLAGLKTICPDMFQNLVDNGLLTMDTHS